MIVPAWINPAFHLLEGERRWDWPQIAELSERIRAKLPVGGRIAVTGRSVGTLLATLIACERARIEVVLLRGDAPRPAGASVLIEADGRFAPLAPSVDTTNECAVLMPTSGTSGAPKLVRHDLIRLMGRIRGGREPGARWLLAYEPTAFAGLQVLFSAVAAGATLIAEPGAAPARLAELMVTHQATHVSAPPSLWRCWLRLPDWSPPRLAMVTLGGEAADQALLDRLSRSFPGAKLRDIYASTEAGAVYSVRDGRAGFPAAWLDVGVDGVALRIANGALELRSPRAMLNYAGGEQRPYTTDGWLITGDLVERVGDRVLFCGRVGDQVAIGGTKVAPEKVEHVLLGVPGVLEVLVGAVAQPGLGNVLGAAVVKAPGSDAGALHVLIGRHTAALLPAEQPRLIRFVDDIALAASGKKARATT
ncbi:MAG: AMP-binding protein [Candidatus Hydrogenedens sp.]|nr:AMP-binding protein [Candidatus Hydrogenedens sp.]